MKNKKTRPLWIKLLRIIGKTVLGFLLFIVLYIASAFILSHIGVGKEAGTSNDVTIYLRTNGVHTDLVLPIVSNEIDWSSRISFANTASKDTAMQYVGIGWGDKGFYLNTPTWADLKFSTAFKAAFDLGGTAMHVTYYKTISADSTCIKIGLSKSQYQKLIGYINKSFQTDASGDNINIKTNANYGPNDAFYEANGGYSLFHTCNTWTNNGLKSCGQKACLWTPFQAGLFYQYK